MVEAPTCFETFFEVITLLVDNDLFNIIHPFDLTKFNSKQINMTYYVKQIVRFYFKNNW